MKNAKIHPFTILALAISSFLMASYAYQNFRDEKTGYGLVFALLSLFLLGLVISGYISKRKNGKKDKRETL